MATDLIVVIVVVIVVSVAVAALLLGGTLGVGVVAILSVRHDDCSATVEAITDRALKCGMVI